MAEEHSLNLPTEPRFDSYLLAQDTKHNCYFMVGKRELVETKKRGVAKKIQMAHSSVLRSQLDLEYPDTFIILLNLSFEKAAEKHMMEPLKARICSRLMTLLSPDNIFQLLNNPACYRLLELQCAITTEILRWETARDLDSPAFLNLNVDDFTKILEQEAMDVKKTQMWGAAVKWARDRTEEGKDLKEQLSKRLAQIRVCCESSLQEVDTTKIPNDLSLRMVCLYHSKKEKQAKLVQVSNETKQGIMKLSIGLIFKPPEKSFVVNMPHSNEYKCCSNYVLILIKRFKVKLLPLEFIANEHPNKSVPPGQTYQCDCTVEITEIDNYIDDTSTKPPVTVKFSQPVKYGELFKVPLTSDREKIRLLPDKKYKLHVEFTEVHTMYRLQKKTEPLVKEEYMEVSFKRIGAGHSYSPFKKLKGKAILYD